jgi:hypothetical protein
LQKCSELLPVGHSELSDGGRCLDSRPNSRETAIFRAN